MAVCNSAVHFIDFPYRHSAVSPFLTAQRIAENIANGGWLDYFVIGHLNNQDDRSCFGIVKELFGFHRKNEKYFTKIRPLADVALVMPQRSSYFGSIKEYKGIFRILAQLHVLFDVIHDSVLDSKDIGQRLKKYKAVILPDTRNMSRAAIDAIDSYVSGGGRILATGAASMCDLQGNSSGNIQLKCAGD